MSEKIMSNEDILEIKQLDEIAMKIYKALIGLRKGEAVVMLERIKFDIILNGGMVRLDGTIGVIPIEKQMEG